MRSCGDCREGSFREPRRSSSRSRNTGSTLQNKRKRLSAPDQVDTAGAPSSIRAIKKPSPSGWRVGGRQQRRGGDPMLSHKFNIDEIVTIKPAIKRNILGGIYQVTRQLPENQGWVRILYQKSKLTLCARCARARIGQTITHPAITMTKVALQQRTSAAIWRTGGFQRSSAHVRARGRFKFVAATKVPRHSKKKVVRKPSAAGCWHRRSCGSLIEALLAGEPVLDLGDNRTLKQYIQHVHEQPRIRRPPG